MNMDSISFNNIEFSIREIEHPDLGMVFISVNSLNAILFNEDGSYFPNEAESIDDMIYYFVDDSEIKLLEKDLINLLVLEVS